ncbi:MAG: hypothetical protein B6230_07915 [Desulfobacteraceae bacterium 4572_89]|nr:MAG: hypothetical protein B6230_07915 [Desulfobacteraceae bacterium 4572_89]
MGDKEKHTIQSISRDFVNTINDFSQYISHQKELGNTDLDISGSTLEKVNAWGLPRKKVPPPEKPRPFFFQGLEKARVLFVDSEGSFFNGESGALFLKILKAMDMKPQSISICNAPDRAAIHGCIKKNQPQIIVTLGQRAGQLLLNHKVPLESFQGKFHFHNGIQVMPTFHPLTLLEQPGLKRKVWEDMQQVMKAAGISKNG